METVIAACVAAVPATIAALAGWRRSKSTHDIVKGNGQGSVDKMQERTLDELASIRQLLVDHVTDRSAHN